MREKEEEKEGGKGVLEGKRGRRRDGGREEEWRGGREEVKIVHQTEQGGVNDKLTSPRSGWA